MKTLRGTYVHRGDRMRRRTRVKQMVLAVSFFVTVGLLLGNRKPAAPAAEAAPVSRGAGFRIDLSTNRSLTAQLDSARGELDLAKAQLERANKIISYSTQYGIGAGLAETIVDVARAEGIDPDLAFRLVKPESDFNPHTTSPLGARRPTDGRPSTARYYQKGISIHRLYDPS